MAAAAIPIASWLGSFFVAPAAGAATGAAAAGAGAAAAGAGAAALPEVAVTASSLAGATGATAAEAGAAGAAIGAGTTAATLASGGGAAPVVGAPQGLAATNAAQASTKGSFSRVLTTAGEAAAVAEGASALYTLSQGPRNPNIPPIGTTGQGQIDQSAAAAAEAERQRLAAAGGLQSTIGTGAGQAGAMLNPSTLSSRTLLGG